MANVGAWENDIVMKRLLDALKRGNTRANAARLAGIEPQTLRLWLKAADKTAGTPAANPRLLAAVVCIFDAEAQAEDEAVLTIRSGQRGWQAMAWWLEHHPSARKRWTVAKPASTAASNDNNQANSLADVALEELEAAVQDAITLKKRA